LSTLARKNPVGLIEAFSRAFAPGEGPTLVLKSINGHLRRADLETVREAARHRPDVVLIDRYLSPEERDGLAALCDCYVSLHRSEGFGLTLAEAMALGKPTIATAYSGNLAFMTPENSFLVPYEPAFVPAGCDPYPQGHRWAEPDVAAAATLMRTVYEHPEMARERGRVAAADIRQRLSTARTAEFLRERLQDIARRRHPPAAVAPVAAHVQELNAAERVAAETEELLADRITYKTPSRFGWPGRVLRTAVLRLIRPYAELETRVHRQHLRATVRLLQSLRALEKNRQAPPSPP
jgi:hypothetical protein